MKLVTEAPLVCSLPGCIREFGHPGMHALDQLALAAERRWEYEVIREAVLERRREQGLTS